MKYLPFPHPPLWRQRFIGDTAYLERCIRRFFTARDIADELLSFDEQSEAARVRKVLQDNFVPVAGLSRDGRIVSCCFTASLAEGPCVAAALPITPAVVADEDEPLLSIIRRLETQPFLLVRGATSYTGLITVNNLQKPPARMLLFAIVSIVELRWQQWIRQHFGESDSWQSCLTPPRLDMASELHEERNRNGWKLDLLDCLQFSDRATIILKTPELWERTVFSTKGEARDRIRDVQRLRDDLAHSQDLLVDDWTTIVELANWIDPALRQLQEGNSP